MRPEEFEGPFRRRLLPLDGSALAEAILPYARRLGGGRGSRVILVQAVPPTPITAGMEAPAAGQIVRVATEERARRAA
jgi:nucleotide-binding universal stress UspA family protein